MELSTFRSLILPPGPDLLGPAAVPFVAALLFAFPLAADVVTSFTACTEKQQNRTRTRTHNRDELIPTAEVNNSLENRTEPKATPPLLIKVKHGRVRHL